MTNMQSRIHLVGSKLARRRGQDTRADEILEKAWNLSRQPDADIALRFGNLALRRGDTPQAVAAFTKAVEAEPKNVDALYKLGFALERSTDWNAADGVYQRAQEFSPGDGRVAFRRGRCLAEMDRAHDAIAQYHLAAKCGHRMADAYLAIYEAEKTSPAWKRLETLRAGTRYHELNFEWLRDRAILASKMGHHKESIEYFHSADRIKPLSKKHRIEMARSHHEVGEIAIADGLLRDLARTDKGPAAQLGPGVYFKERGHWREAIDLFQRKWNECSEASQRASLEFEIGHAYDRQYLWNEAKKWFVLSLRTEGKHAYRHYRLGVTYERLGEYDSAYGPYSRAIQLDPTKKHWWYRLGECAFKNSDVELALTAYQASVPRVDSSTDQPAVSDRIDESEYRESNLIKLLSTGYVKDLDRRRQASRPTSLATWRESLELSRRYEDVSAELTALMELYRRQAKLDSYDAARASELQMQMDNQDQAIEILQATREVRFPDGIDLKRYLSSPELRRRSLFAEFQESLNIAGKVVFLESNHGASVGCHPLALFREMSRDRRFAGFTYVWSHSKNARIPEEVANRPDVHLAEMHSDVYLKHLATAKYLVNNVSFAPYFVRRSGQVYLNTWHGTPMKTLGRSMHQGVLEYENLARNFVQATHVSSPNELTDWSLFDEHRISRYAKAARRITGSPRLDRLVSTGTQMRADIRRELGVEKNERVVLYAPTWRGGVSDHEFDTDALISDLQVMAGVTGSRVFFRAHRLTEKLVAGARIPVEVVPSDIDTNDLLSAVDVLVTDYSSIAFDYLTTRRSLIFYVPDMEEYKRERGLYLEPSELPGTVCLDHKTLAQALTAETKSEGTKYDEAIQKFAPMEDGYAARRTLDFMLETPHESVARKPLVVVHASLIPNGIASALLALLYALDPNEIDIVLVVEGRVIARDEGRQQILARLPNYVDLAFRVGNIAATPEEQWAVNRDESHDILESKPIAALRKRAWTREARRVIGEASPTTAIEFDGYASLWADFIANVGTESTRHLIWQHNQLYDEWRTKYPELAKVFERYINFDAIIPVAESLAVENQNALESAGFSTEARYFPVSNVLDVDRILEQASKPLDKDLTSWLQTDHIQVVSVGRLSPEKNFRSLIEAWPSVMDYRPNARLTILGDGLLRAELQVLIEDLGMESSVKLAGQRTNPYPVIKHADLFILPSTHEGQPVVILEAMTLGVPVAGAFTPGTAELFQIGYGKVVGSEPLSMATDILNILSKRSLAGGAFDPEEYRESAIADFRKAAFGG